MIMGTAATVPIVPKWGGGDLGLGADAKHVLLGRGFRGGWPEIPVTVLLIQTKIAIIFFFFLDF